MKKDNEDEIYQDVENLKENVRELEDKIEHVAYDNAQFRDLIQAKFVMKEDFEKFLVAMESFKAALMIVGKTILVVVPSLTALGLWALNHFVH